MLPEVGPSPASPPVPKLLAGILGVSGVAHLMAPGFYEPMVPRKLPHPRGLVYVSGMVELVAAVGLLARTGWAGPLSAATLVGVWPANVQMALDATHAGKPLVTRAGLWVRVPLQLPMIRMALQAGARD